MGRTCFFLYIPILGFLLLCLLELKPCSASIQNYGKLNPGFNASEMLYIDKSGIFLVSNTSAFGFGFTPTPDDVTLFLLSVIHQSTSTVVWTANRGSPVQNTDFLVFDTTGNVYLQRSLSHIWTANTSNMGVSHMELLDSGNLVLVRNDGSVIWQSFDHPTDTLLSNQSFSEGMKLISDIGSNNLSYSLEIRSGNMILSAGFQPPQLYWSMQDDPRIVINREGGSVTSAQLVANSWKFFDSTNGLLWQFVFSPNTNTTATWVAILNKDGSINFNMLGGSSSGPSPTTIPQNACSKVSACAPASVCSSQTQCQCPATLTSCRRMNLPPCQNSQSHFTLKMAADGISYSPLRFVTPVNRTTLDDCQTSCLRNCSCGGMFFQNSSGNCYFFNEIGSMEQSNGSDSYVSYIKVSDNGSSGRPTAAKGSLVEIIVIVIVTILVVVALLLVGIHFYRNSKKEPETARESSDEDSFLEGISGMPIRFSYKDLEVATNNFNKKLGQGGFGSVYQGTLPDGTQVAVKKLEGIGQGKKEFRAEVGIIGSVHHYHLVRLRGYCAEGSHRLLAYEYMANGSLEKWLFKKSAGDFMLDWETRYNIALGTAKGLAYLHEDCESKIVHCDIKPENVLLDDRFTAKVSDFGLAKLMTREQSHVFTTLRGTRGYLAPEWITSYAISEKSDVYSYGMVLLELIGGRKNYDPSEISEKSHFPSYAFKMMEEGKMREILDCKLKVQDEDERVGIAIKVALWCIQDDMYQRPPMTKVVQMLEGLCPVPLPPGTSLATRLYSSFYKLSSDGGTSSGGPSDCNSDTYVSATRLSGPR